MGIWRKRLHVLAAELERQAESRRLRTRAAGKVVIAPYRGFGRANEMLLRGRVLVEKPITRATSAEPVWRNLLNSYRRFQTDEVPGVGVRARYRDAVVETLSNDEGYFQIRLEPRELDHTQQWHEVGLELADGTATTIAHVLVPSTSAEFAIISDIDDTIVQTGATSLRTMVRTVALTNAAMRLPFEGVADLYRALHTERNPIFYVSSSPWNLYELLHDYMDLNGIPHGPMFLQDFGIDDKTLIHAAHDVHKLEQINLILDYYPTLPFILLGDSGQRDPEIYLEVIRAHPGRVRLALIRDVTVDVRDAAVAKIVEETRAAGGEMVYVKDSTDAIAHAQRVGLV